ncbi:MAG TPA: cytochrome C, partial [Archangium sp.]|nr:cytochrome C [Archangium sp.]
MKGVWLATLALLGGAGADSAAAPRADTAPGVGLALEVENGAGVPLKVRAGQTFFINQLDLRASVTATRDEGVEGLRLAGDFAKLSWKGVTLADEEPLLSPNPDGTFTRRRFYRSARWMEQPSVFTLQPVDAQGRSTGRAISLRIGGDDTRRPNDTFFIRRLRAIQWAHDCRTATDCTTARNFSEEALVEVRHARTGAPLFSLSPSTRALRVSWSLRPGAPYSIPVEQVENPPHAYGFSIDVRAVTPPREDGTYAPGSDVSFQLTLKDGAGNRLHPAGSLPTYNEVHSAGGNAAGIQYYRAFGFIDPSATYYRRKHRERMLMAQLIGPAQRIQPIRSIVELDAFLGPDDVQTIGT